MKTCSAITRLVVVIVVSLGLSPPATAQNFDYSIQDRNDNVEVVDQPTPDYPRSGVRRGQEGWVRVSYVITADGQAIDPLIIDSIGGSGFEESAREAVTQWSFAPSGMQRANNTADIRFEIHRGKDLATSNFMRRHRRIVTHLYNEEFGKAREHVDAALEIGGWNLYESTMLWLMVGRVEGSEGKLMGKMASYRRALGVSNSNSLKNKDRRDLLAKLFELEVEQRQYAAANTTLQLLKKVPGSEKQLANLQEHITQTQAALASEDPIAAIATIASPADDEAGQPLWSYVPARRSFSFAALSGNVERFEVRCERGRLEGPVVADKIWSLPDETGRCRVFVFGENEASFEFVEHNGEESDVATAAAAVAMSNVLD